MAVDAIGSLMMNFLVYAQRVLGVFEEAIAEAKAAGTDKIAVVALPVMGAFPDLDMVRRARALGAVFYVHDPLRNIELLSAGSVATHELQGRDAIAKARAAFAGDLHRKAGDALASPLFYGGFAFAPGGERSGAWSAWPDGLWVWPRWQWVKEGGRVLLIVSVRVNKDTNSHEAYRELQKELATMGDVERETDGVRDQPSVISAESTQADAWTTAVRTTVAEIRAGKLAKAVLARRVVLQSFDGFDALTAIQNLKTSNPTSVSFYWRHQDTEFVGATPERLVETRGQQVMIDCLAGTALRGRTDYEDDEWGEKLLHSAKDLNEHDLVRTGVLAAVAGVAQVSAPSAPRLRRLTHVQHLHTPIRGELLAGKTLFDLVACLHPTPAVAGLPKDSAAKVIAAREPIDRGYYAGPIGWMDADGNGTFVVALRSGLLHGNRAELYAGAGIVGDSDAAAEWEETTWKLAPMKAALGVESELE